MRFLLLPLFLFLAPAALSAQPGSAAKLDAISNYFSEYVDDTTFTAVYISGKLFELLGDSNLDVEDLDDEELKAVLNVVRDVRGIRLLHTNRNALTYYDRAKARIPTDDYELLFKIRTQDGSNVEGFIQDENAAITELFMLIGSRENFTMLSFIGNIDLSKLGELQRALE